MTITEVLAKLESMDGLPSDTTVVLMATNAITEIEYNSKAREIEFS